MFQFICLFFPTLISLGILERNKVLENNLYSFIMNYGIYNLIINFIMLFIVCVYTGFETKLINDELFSASFCLKYIIISTVIAVLIPYVYLLMRKNMIVEVEVSNYEEVSKEKKRKKK